MNLITNNRFDFVSVVRGKFFPTNKKNPAANAAGQLLKTKS